MPMAWRIALCVLACMMLTACAASHSGTVQEVYLNISQEEARRLMETEKDYVIIDAPPCDTMSDVSLYQEYLFQVSLHKKQ